MYEGIFEIMDLNIDLNFLSLKLGSDFLTTVDYNNQTVKWCLMMMEFIYIMLKEFQAQTVFICSNKVL